MAPARALQPVSVRAISRDVSLYAETVRRKANRLIDKHLIKRVPYGLLPVRTPGVASIHTPRAYQQLFAMLAQVALIAARGGADAVAQ